MGKNRQKMGFFWTFFGLTEVENHKKITKSIDFFKKVRYNKRVITITQEKGIIMTITDFKRMATKEHEMRGGFFWKQKDGFDIEKCEWRKITAVQTNGIKLQGSFLDFPKASLADFDGRVLKIYAHGYRKMNDVELSAMKEWSAIAETEEYKKLLEYDMMTDTNMTYYKKQAFFEERGLGYLFHGKSKGLSLDCNKFDKNDLTCECIRDEHIKGEQIAEYEIREAK